MTINAFIGKIVEKNPEQIITIYDRNHNIAYHGKADFAPLNFYDEYKNSHEETLTGIDANPVSDIIINDTITEGPAENTMKEVRPMGAKIINHIDGVKFEQMCDRHGFCDEADTREYDRVIIAADRYGEYAGLTDRLIGLAMMVCHCTSYRNETDNDDVKFVMVTILNEALVWSWA